MGEFVSDHLDRIKDAYNTTSQHFRTYFIALSVFTMFFLTAIFIPYANNSNDRHELDQAISTRNYTIGKLQEFIAIYGLAQNESRVADLDLNTTQGDIKNASLSSPDARRFINRPIDVSSTFGSSVDPQIASFGDNAYVVWTDKTFKDEQALFSNPSNSTNVTRVLGNVSGGNVHPHVAASGENVYVFWSSETQGNNDIFFIKSIDRGRTFGNLTNLSSNKGTSTEVQIAVNGENVYVVWSDDTTGNSEIYFNRSTNNGSSFSNVISNLSNDRGNSLEPKISTFGNNVYVTWIDRRAQTDNILFKRSADNGINFMKDSYLLNTNINTGNSIDLEITAFEDNVYVVWTRLQTSDVYFSSSKNNGTRFSEPQVASLGVPSLNPEIALSRNYVYVVWEGHPGGANSEIYLTRSADNGTSFEPGVQSLSKNGGTSVDPKIATFGEDVYVVWRDSSQGIPVNVVARDRSGENRTIDNLMAPNILFTGSTENGIRGSFIDPINISHDIGSILYSPQISVSANNIYVTWTGNPSGNEEIYLNLDKSGLQEVVLDRFSSYRQMLRETILEPFQIIDKAISNDDVIKNLAIPKNIVQILQTDTKNILDETKILESKLRSLSSNIIEKSENNTLLGNISELENPARAAAMMAIPLPSPVTPSPTVIPVISVSVEDDIQRMIIELKGKTSALTKNLIDQQAALSNQLNISQQRLGEVNSDLEKISNRLETIETPLGPLPVELKDSIPIFPILVAAGLLICLHLLKESICLRKSFQILYHRKHIGELKTMLRPEQTALIAPLWIDPLDSKVNRIVWFIILLIPLIVYLSSIAVIWSSAIYTGTLLNNNYYGWGYTVTYLVLLIMVIWFFYEVFDETRTYKKEVKDGIQKSKLPKCGKLGF